MSSQPLLQVEKLRVRFPSAEGVIDAVKSLSFHVNAGEILALVGESGSGKSATARALVGLAGENAQVDAERLNLTHARQTIDLLTLNSGAWRSVRGKAVGFVLQDALTSLDPLRTVGQEVAEALRIHHKLRRSEVNQRVTALLTDVGMDDAANRMLQYPHELSGGLRQRALIASALAAGPQLLIADEPTTALDVTVQQRILALFRQLADQGHGILLITHDLSVVAKIADRVVVMKDGESVETGTTSALMAHPQHVYTQRLLAAVPGSHTRGQWLSSANTSLAPSMAAQPTAAPTLLEARNLTLAFQRPDGSRHQVLRDVSLKLRKGETLGLVGESGCGKTTLGKVLLAVQKVQRGEVNLAGQAWSILSESQRRGLRARIQTISQDPLGSFDPQYQVQQIIEQPLKLKSNTTQHAIQARVKELMRLVGLSETLLQRRPSALSGGQRQRVAIAQALASDPEILICDEPVSALDVTTQAQVLDLLRHLQQQLGLSMLFISHDPGVVQHMSHQIAVMKGGEIVELATAEQLKSAPQHPYTRHLMLSTDWGR
ncbi:ABC transporter ATP-binding protein [Pantoea rodasii]|uniref:ABC transporter ATP-binding protein n=1 Tax=Pantoea rodasii TaxID=1076549 RepID=A0A2M9W8X9_9GAMM|nr:ABC transporter ATP-binding protein [Pantoea rodasii]ORM63597.1 ABC transporter ATP-binding protein [Pantoea rodasii]PJZ03996.1 ABC transporter ATP-binding protein [Pantoea rodasii]